MLGKPLGLFDPELGFFQPLVKLALMPVGEASGEAGESDKDLRPVDDDALHRHVVDDLAGEGIHAHLVVGVEAGEEALIEGILRRLVVHDIQPLGEANNSVEMSAEKGILVVNLQIGLKSKRKLNCRSSIRQEYGFGGVFGKLIEIPNDRPKKSRSVFVGLHRSPRSPTSVRKSNDS